MRRVPLRVRDVRCCGRRSNVRRRYRCHSRCAPSRQCSLTRGSAGGAQIIVAAKMRTSCPSMRSSGLVANRRRGAIDNKCCASAPQFERQLIPPRTSFTCGVTRDAALLRVAAICNCSASNMRKSSSTWRPCGEVVADHHADAPSMKSSTCMSPRNARPPAMRISALGNMKRNTGMFCRISSGAIGC